jgi:hypothetical protein
MQRFQHFLSFVSLFIFTVNVIDIMPSLSFGNSSDMTKQIVSF